MSGGKSADNTENIAVASYNPSKEFVPISGTWDAWFSPPPPLHIDWQNAGYDKEKSSTVYQFLLISSYIYSMVSRKSTLLQDDEVAEPQYSNPELPILTTPTILVEHETHKKKVKSSILLTVFPLSLSIVHAAQ